MPRYEVFLHLSLLENVPRSGAQRKAIMEFVRSLRERPDTPGDFCDKDATLRERQIKVIGDHAITYWVDAPIKAVMVVDIRLADR